MTNEQLPITNYQLPMIVSDRLRDSAYGQILRRGWVSPPNFTLISAIYAQLCWQFVVLTRPRIVNPPATLQSLLSQTQIAKLISWSLSNFCTPKPNYQNQNLLIGLVREGGLRYISPRFLICGRFSGINGLFSLDLGWWALPTHPCQGDESGNEKPLFPALLRAIFSPSPQVGRGGRGVRATLSLPTLQLRLLP